jgi:hypothetical protein
MPDTYSNPRHPILLKEIDLIHDNIKNLDDIIYKTKNFAILIWGGSLYLIAQHVEVEGAIAGIPKEKLLVYLTVLIPVIFWAIHYRWQKHLSMCSARERMISWFLNSPGFPYWLNGEEDVNFPVYDVPGWLYTKDADRDKWERLGVEVDEVYLLDHRELSFWKILFYKDAKWYYLLMMAVSVLFGMLG